MALGLHTLINDTGLFKYNMHNSIIIYIFKLFQIVEVVQMFAYICILLQVHLQLQHYVPRPVCTCMRI